MKELWKSALLLSLRRVLTGLLLGLILFLQPVGAEPAKFILALGDDSYLPAEAVKAWTGAEVKKELGKHELLEFAVVILSNIPYGGLPGAVSERLSEFISRGGSLLITGGPNSYGSGGYQAVAPIIPFEIRAEQDWVAVPFKAVIPLQPEHPILAGATFRTVGNLNDLNPKKSGAIEIARYAGGGGRRGLFGEIIGAKFPSPLIAEQRTGQGIVVGIAFNLGREIGSGWDGTRLLQNVLTYLVERSPLKPRTKESLMQMFSRWQESCDRDLRRILPSGIRWSFTAADCRGGLSERRFPYMDLVDLWLAERLAIAEKLDRGEVSEDGRDLEIKELNARIRIEIQERHDTTK